MKTSTIVWIVVAVIVIVGAAWWLTAAAPVAPMSTPEGGTASTTTTTSTTTVTTTTVGAIPGDNLTLGQDSNAKVGKYLIGYNGMTLYTYSPDTAGVSNCTGSCAANWPPYVVTSTANLVAESPIAGTIATLTRADGSMQVTYNGHPLYFYVGDKADGDTTGQGVGGVWFAAKP